MAKVAERRERYADAERAREERLDRLLEAAAQRGLDAALVTSDESIAYLTGFKPTQLERFFGVVVAPGRSAVIVPALDRGQVNEAPARLERISYGAESDGIPELVGALDGARSVGVEDDHLIYARSRALEQQEFELIPAGSAIMGLRIPKDPQEIERIRSACQLVQDGLRRAFEWLTPGVAEHALNARVEGWLREQGATAAHPLILFGENAANPHGEPGPRELRPGDVVCADLSACLDGYWGDLTRCATVGAPSDWATQTWDVVRAAQRVAIEAAQPGATGRDVDLAQRRIVEAASELGACLHGAGHAIGLSLHEPPFLVPRNEDPLPEGSVLTIEPGIYKAGVGGIRLEDDVVVRPGGPEMLSDLPLELVEVGG
ncbi:MAG TPA: Xaa-Pro peptidase family protein [Solirubrobacteraceae bacterium]